MAPVAPRREAEPHGPPHVHILAPLEEGREPPRVGPHRPRQDRGGSHDGSGADLKGSGGSANSGPSGSLQNLRCALTHASRMLSNIGGRLPMTQREEKRTYLEKARTYALKATELDPKDADARLAHIITLGLLSEISRNPREKVMDAKLIHSEAKTILSIDSKYPEAYFVLGKWQLELSRLSWIELLACKLLFGGLPEEISKEAALNYFNQGLALNPNSILFLFGQASVYYDMGEHDRASFILQRAINLPLAEPDDAQRKDRCIDLLNKIQS